MYDSMRHAVLILRCLQVTVRTYGDKQISPSLSLSLSLSLPLYLYTCICTCLICMVFMKSVHGDVYVDPRIYKCEQNPVPNSDDATVPGNVLK